MGNTPATPHLERRIVARRALFEFSGASRRAGMRADLPDCSERAYSTALMTKAQPPTRHIISINDLTNKEIETIFEVAQELLKDLGDVHLPYRIGRGTSLASKFIL